MKKGLIAVDLNIVKTEGRNNRDVAILLKSAAWRWVDKVERGAVDGHVNKLY